MKAIIEVAAPGNSFAPALATARKADKGKLSSDTDYHLSFSDPRLLFAELTPARLALLDTLKHSGPQTIYALARLLNRNYSNVHRDCNKLLQYELLQKNADEHVLVPWDEVVIRLSIGTTRAA